MTVIQIRGTSGSGKTYAMKQILAQFAGTSHFVKGRKKPLYYRSGNWAILGHYESNCGGCDNIGSARTVYDLIQSLKPLNILCEGLLLSEDVLHSSKLPDLKILFLTTPLETCLEQIKQRRLSVGNEKPLNPKNTANRVATIERARIRLIETGAFCRRVTVPQAIQQVLKWLE